MFISLPQWFKDEHPEFVKNLEINKNRLTSPYDINMTLKHILELSGRITKLPPPDDCLECQSVFEEIPWDRSCLSAGIDFHWCVCTEYKLANKEDPLVQRGAHVLVDWINNEVSEKTKNMNTSDSHCASFNLSSVESVVSSETTKHIDYRIKFNVVPSDASFDAIVRSYREGPEKLELIGSVSRLTEYGSTADCVYDSKLKVFCFCEKYE